MTQKSTRSPPDGPSETTSRLKPIVPNPSIEEQLSPVARALYRYFRQELGDRDSVEISLSEEELFALLKEPLREAFKEAIEAKKAGLIP
jgi:hypothetical protein